MTTGLRRDQHRGWEIRQGEITPGMLNAAIYGLVGNISTIDPDDAAAAGALTTVARSDHQHAIVADVPVSVGTANAEGAATSFARSNHVHDIAAAAIDGLGLFSTNLFNLVVTSDVPNALRSTTSATYVDWPAAEALSISYTKAIADSRLFVIFVGSGYGTTGNALAQFAIQVDSGADTEISRFFFSELNAHRLYAGILSITGIGSGSRTIKLRAHIDGTNGLNTDTNDFNVLGVLELP